MDLSAWRISPPTDLEPKRSSRRPSAGIALAALRTTGLVVIVTIAILVLLPAMIAAQPTFLG